MNLESLRTQQQRNAERTEILERARQRQKALEDSFWTKEFPVIEKGTVDALRGRGISASWAVLDGGGLNERCALSVSNIGTVMYVDGFRYWISYDKHDRLHLHHNYGSSDSASPAFEDSLPVEPPVVSLRVNVADGSLAPFNVTFSPPDENMGAYRFRWYGAADTARIITSLIGVLDGRRPRSDFRFSGCFLATAVFGGQAVKLDMLRDFRDRYFTGNRAGRLFLAFYYSHSPQIAYVIMHRPTLLRVLRFMLIPLWYAVEKVGSRGSLGSNHDTEVKQRSAK